MEPAAEIALPKKHPRHENSSINPIPNGRGLVSPLPTPLLVIRKINLNLP